MTDTTGPKIAAVRPDSRVPNSFEVPMKMLVTAETRPRISTGGSKWTSVCPENDGRDAKPGQASEQRPASLAHRGQVSDHYRHGEGTDRGRGA